MQRHEKLFAELYGALLGETIRFTRPSEKWIVWPMKGATEDRQEEELKDIRIVGYDRTTAGYDLRVGRAKVE